MTEAGKRRVSYGGNNLTEVGCTKPFTAFVQPAIGNIITELLFCECIYEKGAIRKITEPEVADDHCSLVPQSGVQYYVGCAATNCPHFRVAGNWKQAAEVRLLARSAGCG